VLAQLFPHIYLYINPYHRTMSSSAPHPAHSASSLKSPRHVVKSYEPETFFSRDVVSVI